MSPSEIAHKAVQVASERQAADIVLLDIRPFTVFADYFVILSAETRRHIEGLREEIVKALEESGASLHHLEGTPDSGWVLLDFGDVIIHIFGQRERDYYQLERLWSMAKTVVRIL